MRLKQYLTEKYRMYVHYEMQDGSEYSDHEDFRNKREAVKTLNAYKNVQLDTDLVKSAYYYDDEGNTATLIDKGKVIKKDITLKQLGEARYVGSKRSPKQWVKDYIENMIDNGDIEAEDWGELRYKTWKDFFQAARNGAYDWSEDLWQSGMSYEQEEAIRKLRDKILKVSDSGFSQEKKIFKQRRQ